MEKINNTNNIESLEVHRLLSELPPNIRIEVKKTMLDPNFDDEAANKLKTEVLKANPWASTLFNKAVAATYELNTVKKIDRNQCFVEAIKINNLTQLKNVGYRLELPLEDQMKIPRVSPSLENNDNKTKKVKKSSLDKRKREREKELLDVFKFTAIIGLSLIIINLFIPPKNLNNDNIQTPEHITDR